MIDNAMPARMSLLRPRDEAFCELVMRELEEARKRAMALVRTHDGRDVESEFVCLHEGCQEPVVTHKGDSAGYCTVLQEDGQTHRQMYLVQRRADGFPGPGARPSGRLKAPSTPVEAETAPEQKHIEVPIQLDKLKWLVDGWQITLTIKVQPIANVV